MSIARNHKLNMLNGLWPSIGMSVHGVSLDAAARTMATGHHQTKGTNSMAVGLQVPGEVLQGKSGVQHAFQMWLPVHTMTTLQEPRARGPRSQMIADRVLDQSSHVLTAEAKHPATLSGSQATSKNAVHHAAGFCCFGYSRKARHLFLVSALPPAFLY